MTEQRTLSQRFFSKDNRYLPPIFITLILISGNLTFGLLESLSRTLVAIGTSVVCEAVLGYLVFRRIPVLASAYITGISVGILMRSPAYWPYALCAAIAITSKYAVRWRGRHIFNPSNCAISWMLLLLPEYVATLSIQWGNTIWPMLIIWCLGLVIVFRADKAHVTATYVISFVIFAYIRTAFTGNSFLMEVAPITGPMYQLFIFFMITDPKVQVRSRWAQCLVAFLVALVEMLLRLTENVHAPYYALTIVGPTAYIIDIALAGKPKPKPATPEPQLAAA